MSFQSIPGTVIVGANGTFQFFPATNTTIPIEMLPSTAISDPYIVADIAARDALLTGDPPVEAGEWVVVLDDGSGSEAWFLYVGEATFKQAPVLSAAQIAQLAGLQDALDAKAALSHSHAILDVTGLQDALDLKANAADLGTAAAANTGDFAAASHAHAEAVASGAAGFLSGADKAKLDGVAAGAQVNVPTDLAYTQSTRSLTSSTGADVTLPLATTSQPGLMSGTDKTNANAVPSLASSVGTLQTDVAGKASKVPALAEYIALTVAGGDVYFPDLNVGVLFKLDASVDSVITAPANATIAHAGALMVVRIENTHATEERFFTFSGYLQGNTSDTPAVIIGVPAGYAFYVAFRLEWNATAVSVVPVLADPVIPSTGIPEGWLVLTNKLVPAGSADGQIVRWDDTAGEFVLYTLGIPTETIRFGIPNAVDPTPAYDEEHEFFLDGVLDSVHIKTQAVLASTMGTVTVAKNGVAIAAGFDGVTPDLLADADSLGIEIAAGDVLRVLKAHGVAGGAFTLNVKFLPALIAVVAGGGGGGGALIILGAIYPAGPITWAAGTGVPQYIYPMDSALAGNEGGSVTILDGTVTPDTTGVLFAVLAFSGALGDISNFLVPTVGDIAHCGVVKVGVIGYFPATASTPTGIQMRKDSAPTNPPVIENGGTVTYMATAGDYAALTVAPSDPAAAAIDVGAAVRMSHGVATSDARVNGTALSVSTDTIVPAATGDYLVGWMLGIYLTAGGHVSPFMFGPAGITGPSVPRHATMGQAGDQVGVSYDDAMIFAGCGILDQYDPATEGAIDIIGWSYAGAGAVMSYKVTSKVMWAIALTGQWAQARISNPESPPAPFVTTDYQTSGALGFTTINFVPANEAKKAGTSWTFPTPELVQVAGAGKRVITCAYAIKTGGGFDTLYARLTINGLIVGVEKLATIEPAALSMGLLETIVLLADGDQVAVEFKVGTTPQSVTVQGFTFAVADVA